MVEAGRRIAKSEGKEQRAEATRHDVSDRAGHDQVSPLCLLPFALGSLDFAILLTTDGPGLAIGPRFSYDEFPALRNGHDSPVTLNDRET
jgi:hypothetical protein